MTTIGIDLSINSTGLRITSDSRKPRYYIITSKMSKRQKAFEHNRTTIIEYKNTIQNHEQVKGIEEYGLLHIEFLID